MKSFYLTDAEVRSASVKYGKSAEKRLLLDAKFDMLSGVALTSDGAFCQRQERAST